MDAPLFNKMVRTVCLLKIIKLGRNLLLVYLTILNSVSIALANNIEFNTDLLDVSGKKLIDSGVFSKPGYIVPGNYTLQVFVNENSIGERELHFYSDDKSESKLCLTKSISTDLGLKNNGFEKLISNPLDVERKDSNSVCYDFNVLDGFLVKTNLSKNRVDFYIPQVYLEYNSQFWTPPKYWDYGVNGFIFDYGMHLQRIHDSQDFDKSSFSSYGLTGINVKDWRLRLRWQGQYNQENKSKVNTSNSSFEINNIYAYKTLPSLGAKLMLGELNSHGSIFEGVDFTGISLESDDSLLPPDLRGYAPEIVGHAKTDAKVIVTNSSGQIVYQTQVASGSFRIRDISSSIRGQLNVRVEEQDGSFHEFTVNTASIPYLSRPGSVRYKFNAGKAKDVTDGQDAPIFVSSEFSWGVSNGWSVFGGGIMSDGYYALNLGFGRDLLDFGTISFDITESYAQLDSVDKHGNSYRINYSKTFEEYNSEVAFAGYRFSDMDYMNMQDYIKYKHIKDIYIGNSKELYTVLFDKQFKDERLTAFANYDHQTYWNGVESDRVSLNLTKEFDALGVYDISASLSAYHERQSAIDDNGFYLNFSIPLGNQSSLRYGFSSNGGSLEHDVSFSRVVNDRSNYVVSASSSPRGENISGFYNYLADDAALTAYMSHMSGGRTTASLNITGGITATSDGASLHRIGRMGGTRIMVDTDGVKNVPIRSGDGIVGTNKYGMAVIGDIPSGSRHQTAVDVNHLSDDVEPLGSPVLSSVMDDGAIGYRKFEMLSGSKLLLELKMSDGDYIPFAYEVYNDKNQLLGMVGDGGMTYLVGLHANDRLSVVVDNNKYCEILLPSQLPSPEKVITLVCQ